MIVIFLEMNVKHLLFFSVMYQHEAAIVLFMELP